MRLEIGGGKPVKSPTDQEVADAVRNLAGRTARLIGEDEGSFMKVTGGPGTYTLLYCDGLTQRRFNGVGEQSPDKAVVVMVAYNRGDQSYKTAIPWEEVRHELNRPSEWDDPLPDQYNRGGCTTVLVLVAALVAAAAGAAAWLA